jgi:hypothetical protein
MRILCIYCIYIYTIIYVYVCVVYSYLCTIIVIRALVAATLKLQPWAEILLFSGLFQPLLCCDWLSEDSSILGGGIPSINGLKLSYQ